jgi:hypothetical protein
MIRCLFKHKAGALSLNDAVLLSSKFNDFSREAFYKHVSSISDPETPQIYPSMVWARQVIVLGLPLLHAIMVVVFRSLWRCSPAHAIYKQTLGA